MILLPIQNYLQGIALDIVTKLSDTPTNPELPTRHYPRHSCKALRYPYKSKTSYIAAKHCEMPTDPKPATMRSPGHSCKTHWYTYWSKTSYNIQGMVLDTITKHLRRPYQSKISNIAWLETELLKPVTPLTTSELNRKCLILQPLTFNTAEYIF